VVGGFAEADISNIKVGEPATITLAALTNVELSGTVTAVAPTSTVSSNVVTYDVTIAVSDPPSDVKIGMTADVSVITASKSGVLEVPSAAITTTGNRSTVTLLQGGKQTTTAVVTGLVGSSTTQILSGVSVGQVLVEPTVSASASSSSTSTGSGTGTGSFSGGGFGGGAP
jgi:multidrug efflux pump subunit AcrA (membrane-fusion protein)